MADENPVGKAADAAKDKMDDLEKKLDKQSSKLPVLSDSNKDMVVGVLPWAAGIFGILTLFWANNMWDGARNDFYADLDSIYSISTASSSSLYIAAFLFLGVAVLVGFAFLRGIMNMTKEGWNFLFYAMSLSVVTGLFYLFFLSELSSGRGWLTTLVGLGGLYVLFQVKNAFNKS